MVVIARAQTAAGRPRGSPVPEHGHVQPLHVSWYGRPSRSPWEPARATTSLTSTLL